MIRPFTVSQIRGLTSIRRGLGKDHIPFPVNSNSIIASQKVSGGVLVEIKEISEKVLLQNQRAPNPEGSCFHKTGGVPIQRGLKFTNSEGS